MVVGTTPQPPPFNAEFQMWKSVALSATAVINTTDKAVTNDRLRMLGFLKTISPSLTLLFSKPSDILITGRGHVRGINH